MPSGPDNDQSLSKTLVGSWELVLREDRTPAGELRIDPSLGENPIAFLIYDRGGNFAAQFMKRDRSDAPTLEEGVVSAPNNSRARGGYDAYFGTFVVDDAAGTVTQRLTGALSAENVGQVLTRAMNVSGNELTIELETTTVDADPVIRTLRWKRVA